MKNKILGIIQTRLAAWAVLFISLSLTFWSGYTVNQGIQREAQLRFDSRVAQIEDDIHGRVLSYEQILRGAQGLFAASDNVTRSEWHNYVEKLKVYENYPGIQGIGFSLRIRPQDFDSHISSMRKEGFPDYEIKPAGKREEYTSIIYIEPFSGRNLRAFGYDMFSDPVRREAMEKSRDTGNAAISGKVRLLQETEKNVQAGFLMYLPVYRNGKPHETVEEKRASLLGYVYSPFRMDDLMSNIIDQQHSGIDVEIYDGDLMSAEKLMYDKDHLPRSLDQDELAKFSRSNKLELLGKNWVIQYNSLPEFELSIDHTKTYLILGGGASISLLFFAIVLSMAKTKETAFALAAKMTEELQQSQKRLESLANYDNLTGLANRNLLYDRLNHAIARARREHFKLGVLFVDLDGFKEINDRFGHAAGDFVLAEVANRLTSCMRKSDTVARLGGDEFIVLAEKETENDSFSITADRIIQAVNESIVFEGKIIKIGASIGIAVFPENGTEIEELLQNADKSMYAAKESGKNRYRYCSSALPVDS